MAARAIWKGVIEFGKVEVPVKMYSAVSDRSVHFRLLHRPDKTPVEQRMVNPVTGEVVPKERIRKGMETEEGIVILDEEELATLDPEKSRTIEIVQFVTPEKIDHRWYVRPYWLGPDESTQDYFALARALEEKGLEGIARWTMRNQRYQGALRLRDGYLLLVTLRHPHEVASTEEFEAPKGRALEKREVALAAQLVQALSGDFEPERYKDEYRERVLELVEARAKGRGKPKVEPIRRRRAAPSLEKALVASLRRAEERSVA